MNKRLLVIATSLIALTLSSLTVVHADQAGSKNGQQEAENFQYTGLRSHGEPVRNFLSSAPISTMSSNSSPAVAGDSAEGDAAWLQSLSKVSNAAGVLGQPVLSPISCHGSCQTMTGNIALIPVWVGAWVPADLAKWNTVLGNIVTSLGVGATNSVAKAGHVLNTNSLYFTTKAKIAPSLQWVNNADITAPTATSVSDANVATDINTFIAAHKTIVPTGTTPIYMYIGAKTTRLTSGFGTKYCGWHSYGTTSTLKNVQYLAIQDFTSTYFGACAQQTVSPNGSTSLDAMASVLTHEIDETLTDPFLNAWYDGSGSENADKCAWTFGTTTTTAGYQYNVQLGALKYLIQQNWLANNLITATGLTASTACSVVG
jgi:hypothetical protein